MRAGSWKPPWGCRLWWRGLYKDEIAARARGRRVSGITDGCFIQACKLFHVQPLLLSLSLPMVPPLPTCSDCLTLHAEDWLGIHRGTLILSPIVGGGLGPTSITDEGPEGPQEEKMHVQDLTTGKRHSQALMVFPSLQVHCSLLNSIHINLALACQKSPTASPCLELKPANFSELASL